MNRSGGCVLVAFGGLFAAAGLLFLVLVALVVAGVIPGNINGFAAVVAVAVPLVHLVVGVGIIVVGLRVMNRPPAAVTPAAPLVPRVVKRSIALFFGGFAVMAAAAFGGVVAAQQANAPGWVLPLVFFAPGVVFAVVFSRFGPALGAAMARAAPSPESLAASSPAVAVAPPITPEGRWPTVPEVGTGPGAELAHALHQTGGSTGCQFVVMVCLSLFWNGIVSVFVWQAVAAFRRGQPEWFLTVFLVPFVLVGVGLVVGALLAGAQWLIALLAGKVAVELSAHPLVPGGRCEARVRQGGFGRLTGVRVELVLEECATYTEGTNTRTETKDVARHPAEVDAGGPPLSASVAVPADAMHSFETKHNKLTWKIRVAGRVWGVLPHKAEFAVAVVPG